MADDGFGELSAANADISEAQIISPAPAGRHNGRLGPARLVSCRRQTGSLTLGKDRADEEVG